MKICTKAVIFLVGFVILSQIGLAQDNGQRINRVINNLQVIDNWQALPIQTGESSNLISRKVPGNVFTKNKKVTLRYLLSHQAGIPPSDLISSEEGKPVPTLPQVLSGEKPALNPAAVPEFEPGSQWTCSKPG